MKIPYGFLSSRYFCAWPGGGWSQRFDQRGQISPTGIVERGEPDHGVWSPIFRDLEFVEKPLKWLLLHFYKQVSQNFEMTKGYTRRLWHRRWEFDAIFAKAWSFRPFHPIYFRGTSKFFSENCIQQILFYLKEYLNLKDWIFFTQN